MDQQTRLPQTNLPSEWNAVIARHVTNVSPILAWVELDLDSSLDFSEGILLLTDTEILALYKSGRGQKEAFSHFTLDKDCDLRLSDKKSVARLELFNQIERLAFWNFTSGKHSAATRFVQRFKAVRSGEAIDKNQTTICPSCGTLITDESGICTACAPAANPPVMSSLFRLLQFAKPRAGMIAMGLLLTLLGTIASLVPPYLTMPLMDDVLIPWQRDGQKPPTSLLYWYLGGLFLFALISWGLDWARTYVLAWISERISADMRSRTYAHLQKLSMEFFGGKRTGDLMSRIGSDSDRICSFLSVHLVGFISDTLMIVLTSMILLSINFKLAIVTLAPFPIIIWLSYTVRAKLRRGFRQSSVSWGEMTSVLADTIPGIRVVKAFAQERREIDRFDAANQRVLDANDNVNVVWAFFGPLVRLMTELGLLIVWTVGAWMVLKSDIKIGVLTAFITYIGRFYNKTEAIVIMVSQVQRAGASAQRIFEILDRTPSVPEPVKPVHPGRLTGAIELKEVRFKYGTREVLHGLNLKIQPNEMIGLVGPSGAGKSTLVNLVCRFYDVAEGAILVDGHDTRSFPVAEYRQNIGIVLQDPFLFFGTIAENIAYGKPNASREEIVAAARMANAHEFILRLADGYDSMVGERGQSLSGGERQRISIARALLIDPRILILDEATSAVDTETERQIQSALDTLIEGRTTIAIAHRLSTLRRANRLVVVDKGNIVEIGTHEELLEKQGTYFQLYQAQQNLVREIGVM